MNIVINALSARTGGGITYLRQVLPGLSTALNSAGADTHLLLSPEASRSLSSAAAGNVVLHQPRWSGTSGAVRLPMEQAYLPRLFRFLGAKAVLHVGDTLPLASRVPSLLLCRNMLLYDPAPKTNLRLITMRALARLSIERATAVAFVSQTIAARVLEKTTIRRWQVIHHGPGLNVPFRAGPRETGQTRLLVVSSLYDYKRVELAIQTVGVLRGRSRPVVLQIIGQGVERRYYARLLDLVHQLDLEQFVHFAGQLDTEDVIEAYSASDVALVTSKAESFCHPILEAFSGGVPLVIVNDLPVGAEIAGAAAVYAAPAPEAFAAAIERLIDHPAEYTRYVDFGTARSTNFSWSKAAVETSDLLLSCAQ